jgi:hypothetical protein
VKCGTPYKSKLQRCFLPIWLVEYKDSGKSEQTTITDSKILVDSDADSNQLANFKKYEVFRLKCKECNAYIKSLLFILNRLVEFIGVIILIV